MWADLYCSVPEKKPEAKVQNRRIPYFPHRSNCGRRQLWLTSPEWQPIKCGKLGAGPMIGVSPTLDREMKDKLVHIAKRRRDSLSNGSNGWFHRYQCRCHRYHTVGVRTALISIPFALYAYTCGGSGLGRYRACSQTDGFLHSS